MKKLSKHLLCTLGCTMLACCQEVLFAQTFYEFELILDKVEWFDMDYDGDECCGPVPWRPEPTFILEATPTMYSGGSFIPMPSSSTQKICVFAGFDQPTSGSFFPTNNNKIALTYLGGGPDIGPGFDLCSFNRNFAIDFTTNTFESDLVFDDCEFSTGRSGDRDDDDLIQSFGHFPFDLLADEPNVWKTNTIGTLFNGKGGRFTFRFRYTYNALKEVLTYKNTGGGTQSTFCEGDMYRIEAEYTDPDITGGYHLWEQWNGSQWVTIPGETRNYIDRPITNPITHYQVRQIQSPSGTCIYDNQAPISTFGLTSPTIVPAPPSAASINAVLNRSCPGTPLSITLHGVNGYSGTTPFKVTLTNAVGIVVGNIANYSNNQGPFTFNNLNSDSYFIKVSSIANNTDGETIANCTTVKGLGFLSHYPEPILSAPAVSQPNCPGDQGAISISVSNGNGPFTYTLLDAGNSVVASLNSSGAFSTVVSPPFSSSYRVQVSNTYGCMVSSSTFGFFNPVPMSADVVISLPIKCKGETGRVLLNNISGGVGPYDISWRQTGSGGPWTTAATDVNAMPPPTIDLPDGAFDFRLVDVNGCVQEVGSVTLTEPAVALAIAASSTPASACSDNGTITAGASWGEAPYTFSIPGYSPDPGAGTTATFSGIPGGTSYVVSVTDNRGCVQSYTIAVGKQAPLSLTVANQVDVTCAGDANGSLTVSASGGRTPYMYSLNGLNFQPSPVFQTLSGGSYTVTLADADGCQTTVGATIDEPESFFITAYDIVQPILCPGDLATVIIDIDGRTAADNPLMISTDGGNTFNPISLTEETEPVIRRYIALTLGLGVYDIVIKDQNDCIANGTVTFTLTEPTAISAVLDSTNDISCSGADDGRIHLDLTGGTAPYMVTLIDADDNSQVQLQSGVSTGPYILMNVPPHNNYSVLVTDANNCMATITSIDITTPDLLQVVLQNTGPDIDCSLTNGEVTATASGGTSPYMYSLDNINFGSSAVLTGAGTSNTVYVRDANGCLVQETINIPMQSFQPNPVVTILDPAIDQCQNAMIRVDFTPNGFTHNWSISAPGPNCDVAVATATTGPGESFFEISDLPAGSYQLCATAANCTLAPVDFEVENMASLTLETTSVQHVLCFGDATGSVMLLASGGVGPYTITQNNSNPVDGNTATYSSLSAGTYFYQVTDSKGCTAAITIPITQPNLIFYDQLTLQDALCADSASGSIAFRPIGGNGSYTVQWRPVGGNYALIPLSGGQAVLSDITAGSYQFSIEDANNCSQDFTFSINEPTAVDLVLSDTTHISCFGADDGSIFANGSGGTGDLSYAIDGGSFGANPLFTNISHGLHTIHVRDENDCEVTRDFNLLEPTSLQGTVGVVDVQCYGANDGTITVNATGGTPPYRYRLGAATSQVTNVFSGLAPDTYQLVITDANGCTFPINNVLVDEPDSLMISTVQLTEATCQSGGSAMVTYSGGTPPYTVVWDNNPSINTDEATDLAAGIHTVEVTDAQGCVIQDEIEITTLGVPIIHIVEIESPDCDEDNGSIQIDVRGNTLTPFTYTIDGDTMPDGNFTDLAAGSYLIGVSDNLGCMSERTVVVTPAPLPTLEVVNMIPEACRQGDGEVTLSPVGGESPYQLTMNGTELTGLTIAGLSYGAHAVSITDNKECTSDFTFMVDSVRNPTATLSSLGEVCDRANGQITVTPTSEFTPFTYAWSHDSTITSATASNLTAGNYEVTLTNSRGCSSIFESTVPFIRGPRIVLEDLVPASCDENNGRIKVSLRNAGSGFNINWGHNQSNALTQTNLSPGTYFLTVTNASACQDTMSFSVEREQFPATSIDVQHATCAGNDGSISLTIDGSGPYSYQWSHNDSLNEGLATGLSEGDYSVIISDSAGCSVTIDTSIVMTSTFAAALDTVVDTQCGEANGMITIQVMGENPTYFWSHDSTLNSPTALNLLAGTYQVLVNDGAACSITLEATITDEGSAEISLIQIDSATCGLANGGATISLSGGLEPVTTSWYHQDLPDSVLQEGAVLTGVPGGSYLVLAEDANGCTNTMEVEVPVTGSLMASVTTTPPTCPGAQDGTATVVFEDAPQTINYLWNDENLQTTQIASGLGAGMYEVQLTADGCTTTLAVDIVDPGAHEVSLQVISEPGCAGAYDGAVGVDVTGGSAGLQYTLNGVDIAPITRMDSLPAGIYFLSVVDSSGCIATDSLRLEEPDTLSLTLSFANGPSCVSLEGGNAQVQVSGGTAPYTIQWTDSARQTTALALDLTPGLVGVQVVDARQCMDSLVVDIPFTQAALLVERLNLNVPTCHGDTDGSIELNIPEGSGNYLLTWNDSISTSQPLLQDLGAGIYTVYIEDAATGCEGRDTITLDEPQPMVTTFEVINESCDSTGSDGSISVQVMGGNGGYLYQWDDAQMQQTAMATQLSGGLYTVSITDVKGCLVVDSAQVRTSGILQIDLGGSQVVLCQGEQHYIELPDSTGINYQWSGPNGFNSTEGSLYLPGEGLYFVDVDQSGCSSRDSILVSSSAESLNALFVLPSQVVLGDTVVAVEVSWPTPDAIDWFFNDPGIQHIPINNNTHYFLFENTGSYDISLQSTIGSCVDFVTKTIQVAADSASFEFPIDFGTQDILELSMAPNPNNGIFTVNVKLSSVADIFVQINNTLGTVVETRQESGADEYALDFNLNLQSGLHALTLQAKSSRKTIMFLVE